MHQNRFRNAERRTHSTALTVTNHIYEASAEARNRLVGCRDTGVLTSSITIQLGVVGSMRLIRVYSPDMSVSLLIQAENQAYLTATSSVKQKICVNQMIRPSVVAGLTFSEMYLCVN